MSIHGLDFPLKDGVCPWLRYLTGKYVSECEAYINSSFSLGDMLKNFQVPERLLIFHNSFLEVAQFQWKVVMPIKKFLEQSS